MPVITLTSDWGLKDPYLASVKGTILTQLPDATIVDISHNIAPFDLNQASFIIRNSYKSFPLNSIHILSINPEASIQTPHTVVRHDGYFFIGADNGIFSLIFDKEPEQIVEIDIFQDSDYFTFPTRDVFVKAAVHIAKGGRIEDLGTVKSSVNKFYTFQPVVDSQVIKGKVMYIDAFENLITNITETLFRSVGKGKKFQISFRTPGYNIISISKSYSDVPEGEMLAIFGSTGFLEIAMNKGNASSLLGMEIDDMVRIEFS
ncbi:MAG: SAM-dependent chlorinase/fluorinase [Bacteroidetes bacterium]|nr:SAM-dependent chlorinase/fluorinase [Bacteroidota bacterium]